MYNILKLFRRPLSIAVLIIALATAIQMVKADSINVEVHVSDVTFSINIR